MYHHYFRTVSSPREKSRTHLLLLPAGWAMTLLSVSMYLLILDVHCMESSSIWPLSGFFHLALRIQVHPCGNIHKHLISFVGWIIFHCMINQVNVYPFINWWAWVLTVILTIINSGVWISVCKFFYMDICFNSPGYVPRVDIWIKMFQKQKLITSNQT